MAEVNIPDRLQPWSPASYRITVDGPVPPTWSDCFAGMRITTRQRADESVVTCLTGRVIDQSELAGMLNALADLCLSILSVEQVAEPSDETPEGRAQRRDGGSH